jgi:hypothetical protein
MAKIEVPDLEILRSDLGDGGWSLHAPAGAAVSDSVVLRSGASRKRNGTWTRPSQRDYAKARAEYRRRMRNA